MIRTINYGDSMYRKDTVAVDKCHNSYKSCPEEAPGDERTLSLMNNGGPAVVARLYWH